MRLIFLTLVKINSLEERGIYQDLLRYFWNKGHDVSIVCPTERRFKQITHIIEKDRVRILQVRTLNVQKTNLVEKGIATLTLEFQYSKAIRKYFCDEKFDLILYSTPPITFNKIIKEIKRGSGAYSYLLLKDIFPQNAVDMKMIKKGRFLYNFFRKKEKELYDISDTIGCMSAANVDFIRNNNPFVSPKKLEVNPNTIEYNECTITALQKESILDKFNIPNDKLKLIYGGNLGKPQGIDFLLETISESSQKNVFFVIVGDGTEFEKIKNWFAENQPKNALLIRNLPKYEYDNLLQSCDVGLIFLHKDFTIPNFPSRLLSYLEMGKPVVAATDSISDVGIVIERNGCGYKAMAGNQNEMQLVLQRLIESNLSEMGENAKKLLKKDYNIEVSYNKIIEKIRMHEVV